MIKRRIFLGFIALGLVAGVGIFDGCKKNETTSPSETKIVNDNLTHKWFFTEGYMIGNAYIPSDAVTAYWHTYHGGYIWIWSHGRQKKFYVGGYAGCPPSNVVGLFVQQTLVNLINASPEQRTDLVIENLNGPDDELVRLSTVIDNALLTKVVNGEYVISHITETISTNENQLTFQYVVSFVDKENGYVYEATVPFIWEESSVIPPSPDVVE